MESRPKISIISPSKNTGRFVKETIESIMAQTYKNWEHIIVDGVSTDETLEVVRQYSHIRLLSEPDSGPDDALRKGLAMAKGEYVMMCCVSDGYLDKKWLKRCVEILDQNPEISLVWGIDQNMLEDGTLHTIVTNPWFENPPPNGKDYIYYWLKDAALFHERDLCVRKSVFEECFPKFDSNKPREDQEQGHLMFAYNFNTLGYLPHLIQVVAAYGRQHDNAISQDQAISGESEKRGREYYTAFKKFKSKIIKGEVKHCYRDGFGNILPYKFEVKKCFDIEKENKLRKMISYLVPPIFIWFKNKVAARYGAYKHIQELRKRRKIKSEER
ncbi:MAG: glycosyltransferase [Candidatus Omnitrophica bacterium]|nr:glycosyltransferase [Candidatus Omnitrophota bacterium]